MTLEKCRVKMVKKAPNCFPEVLTHFLLASQSAGIIDARDSSSSSCFKTDGAFTVTLLSRTVAPRFLPETNK